MSEYVEFQGKSLDEAIEAACKHYDLKRDKLEIEIISGGSTGIFGLVGVKKASIKARPRGNVNIAAKGEKKGAPGKKQGGRDDRKPAKSEKPRREKKETRSGDDSEETAQPEKPKTKEKPRRPQKTEAPQEAPAPAPAGEEEPAPIAPPQAEEQTPQPPQQEAPAQDAPSHRDEEERGQEEQAAPQEQPREERGPAPLAEVDKAELEEIVRECMMALLTPIVPDPPVQIEVLDDRVNVFIDDEEHSGLIIGREGQTLSSLQYLAGRIVSRRMEMNVRIQLDTGDYRERQNEKLRQQAAKLAEKAASSGRVQSTRAMSSYHRRVVHLALQDHNKVFTRSKGEGPVKRVLIIPKRRRRR